MANQKTDMPLYPTKELITRLVCLTTSNDGFAGEMWVVGIPPNMELVQPGLSPNRTAASLASLLMPPQFWMSPWRTT